MILKKITKVLDKIRELPTLPVIANKVSALLNDPKTDTIDLARIVEKDQSITTKILNIVNSSYYSLPQEVTNITQAISLLGYKNVSYIIMALSVFDHFIFTQLAPWWWALVGVATASDIKSDLIFKELN